MQFCEKLVVDLRSADENESEAKGKPDNGAKRSKREQKGR
jgi:hypothetical protein